MYIYTYIYICTTCIYIHVCRYVCAIYIYIYIYPDALRANPPPRFCKEIVNLYEIWGAELSPDTRGNMRARATVLQGGFGVASAAPALVACVRVLVGPGHPHVGRAGFIVGLLHALERKATVDIGGEKFVVGFNLLLRCDPAG